MRASFLHIIGLLFLSAFAVSCNEKDAFELEPVSAYVPLQVGKYITYRLDSTVFVNFGRKEEVHTYQEKHVVDAEITDNQNRPSYRMIRYLRDFAGTGNWNVAGTYFITPTDRSVEVVENNMRVIRLTQPVKEGTTWKGNSYLFKSELPSDPRVSEPYAGLYNFGNDDNMQQWDFTIESTGETITLNGKSINDVVTVSHVDEQHNVPITDAFSIAYKTYSVDKYAKGIGLVYQELVMWEYQPNINASGQPDGYKVGFGIRRSLLDYN